MIIGFCLGSIALDFAPNLGRAGWQTTSLQKTVGRGPASLSTIKKPIQKKMDKKKVNKQKIKIVKKMSSPKKIVAHKKIKSKESIKNWQEWNTFQINLTETYAHNAEIFGTYKLVSSTVELARSEKQGTIFSEILKGQLGHMVIKRGKFYLFRPMSNYDAIDNLTQVESIDFPIRMYRNGKDRFLSARLDGEDQRYFYKLKNYLPIFRTKDQEVSNNSAMLLQENYDSDVKFTCYKNQPNTYVCNARVTFTKKYTDMVSINNPEQNAAAKRLPTKKI